MAVCALVLSACSSSSSSVAISRSRAKPLVGGTATYAHEVGDDFTWIFPLPNEENYEPWDQNTEYSMWRPLYFSGKGSEPVVNESLSLAYPPVWSDHDRTITIRLKHYRWSDGDPVTTRDIEFWWNLYRYNKSAIGTYIPGDLPDNVASIDWVSPAEFVMHLTQSFSQQWYDLNELSLIIPLPQQTWDKESLSGRVANYDLTPVGAKKVFSFLTGESEKLTTYQSNPLWKVVDGPWVLTGYNPTTYETTLSVNSRYSGPDKPHLDHVIFVTPTSSTAEIDGLRSGSIDYGYLPYSDYGLVGSLEHDGFAIKAWEPEYLNFDEFGYTGPYAKFVDQLYIRQSLQHLVNEKLYINDTLHGLGQYTYGPVPNLPGSPYVSPEEKTDPDPYSVAAARRLLREHGWKPNTAKVMTCERVGTAPQDCGAGITRGTPLVIKLMYETDYPTLVAQLESYVTSAAAAGITIDLDPQSETTMFSIGGVCDGPGTTCDWGIIAYSVYLWDFTQNDALPTGGEIFGKGNYWGGGYSSPEADRLIALTHTESGISHIFAYENYISRQVAALWVPTWDNRISVVKDSLQGWQVQQAFGDPRPSQWYYTASS